MKRAGCQKRENERGGYLQKKGGADTTVFRTQIKAWSWTMRTRNKHTGRRIIDSGAKKCDAKSVYKKKNEKKNFWPS